MLATRWRYVIRVETCGSRFERILGVESEYEFVVLFELGSYKPVLLLISTFIPKPSYQVFQLTSSAAVVIARVEDCTDRVKCVTFVIVFWRWWRFVTTGKGIGNGGFELGDVEYRVDFREVGWESKGKSVRSMLSNDCEWTEILVSEFAGRSSAGEVLGFDIDLIANANGGCRHAVSVSSCLVLLLSALDFLPQHLVKLVEVGDKVAGLEGGDIAVKVSVEIRIVTFVCKERRDAGSGIRGVVVSKFRER